MDFDKLFHKIGIALLVVAVFFIVKYLSDVLLPFFIAWFFAYLLYPIVKFVQYKLKVKVRAIAIIITMILVFGVIGGIVYAIIPPMVEQVGKLGQYISAYVTVDHQGHSLYKEISNFLQDNKQEIQKWLTSDDVMNSAKEAMPQVFNVIGKTASIILSIFTFFIILMYMFFILLDYEYLTEKWLKIFPEKNRQFWREVAHDVERAMNSYVRGQGTVAFIMGCLFCIGFTIIDFPMAIGLGILIGILDLVPYLHTVALIPTAFLALMKSAETGQSFWIIFGSAIAVFCVVQVTIDMVVTPKIMGKAMNLNPAVLLLALSVWGALLGFIGLIIALPLTTLIMSYWRRYVTREETLYRLRMQEENRE